MYACVPTRSKEIPIRGGLETVGSLIAKDAGDRKGKAPPARPRWKCSSSL